MKHFVSILVLIAATGCASQRQDAARPTPPPTYTPASAAALAFDPPVALGTPMPSLDRQGRAPEAFAGYEQTVTSYYFLHQRDELRSYTDNGNLRRDAYTERTSVTTR